MRKIVYVFIGFIAIITIAIAVIFNINTNNDKNEIIEEPTNEGYESGYFSDRYIKDNFGVIDLTFDEKQQMIYYNSHKYEMLLKMMEKGSSWRCFPIQKSIKDKYSEKDGVLGEYNFDSVVYSDKTLNDLEEYGSVGQISVIGTKGKEKKQVYMSVSFYDGLETFIINKVIDITDKDGNNFDTRLICNKDNWIDIIHNFVDNDISIQSQIAVTDSFKSLYANFNDIFEKNINDHQNYTTPIYSIESEQQNDFDDLSVVYRCFEKNDSKIMRLYKVKFILDANKYIDNIEVSIVD